MPEYTDGDEPIEMRKVADLWRIATSKKGWGGWQTVDGFFVDLKSALEWLKSGSTEAETLAEKCNIPVDETEGMDEIEYHAQSLLHWEERIKDSDSSLLQEPIEMTEDGKEIMDGYHRLTAAKAAGKKEVPTRRIRPKKKKKKNPLVENPTNLLVREDDAVDILMRDLEQNIYVDMRRKNAIIPRPYISRFVELCLEAINPLPDEAKKAVSAAFQWNVLLGRDSSGAIDRCAGLRLDFGTVTATWFPSASIGAAGRWRRQEFKAEFAAYALMPDTIDEILEKATQIEFLAAQPWLDDSGPGALVEGRWTYDVDRDGQPRRFMFYVEHAYKDLDESLKGGGR